MAFSVNGICGWLGRAHGAPPDTLAAMETPLQSQPQSPRLSTDVFAACVPKGWFEKSDDDVVLAVCGMPYFPEAALAEISRVRNPAAAEPNKRMRLGFRRQGAAIVTEEELIRRILDEDVLIFLIGGTLGVVGIVFGTLAGMIKSVARERTRREIAAYIAEGSMSPEQGERLMKSNPKT